MTWFILGTIILIVASVILVLIILAQRPQGGGLASAFGGSGGGGTDTAFGGKTGDVLTIATIIAFVGYLLVAVFLNIMDNRLMGNAENEIQQAEEQVDAPVPTEALETITPTELSTLSGETAPTTVESTTETAPIGSTENDLPGQE
ncbi:MAG: preprotein translocase subunit SecG [Phycisphaerales bacterium]|nr:preprotein translocase subunit SecG [Phycisphaerales bacterium]